MTTPTDSFAPYLVMANSQGEIFDHPELLMLCRHGNEWGLPRPKELIQLPAESELFLLPNRHAVGLNPTTGEIEVVTDMLAVAAFIAPGHTISAHPAYEEEDHAPILPLFAYGAIGFYNDKFYVCAHLVDHDLRQRFKNIPKNKIAKSARELLSKYPNNRLIGHILNNCVARYDCPAARNFALGRYEAPLPTARSCNAKCLGCISAQDQDSKISTTPQCRISFIPTPEEICEVMQIHASRELKQPIFSFGQGCEGDPLVNHELLCQATQLFRDQGGHGTVNCNTNGSNPSAIPKLAQAGLTSMRVSLNSAQEELYHRYYRNESYTFDDVLTTLQVARTNNIFVSLNLLFFPAITDTEAELEALAKIVGDNGVSMIQWRNLNIDPVWYYNLMHDNNYAHTTTGMGLQTFMKRLKKLCPWLIYGYFNPYLGDHAKITAPLPYTYKLPNNATL